MSPIAKRARSAPGPRRTPLTPVTDEPLDAPVPAGSATFKLAGTVDAAGVDLQGVVKSWRGSAGPVHAVRGIDLSVAPGKTVALLGPNGAGKSTTIDMLLGLAAPDIGRVLVFGGPPRAAIEAGRVGAMLQTGDLIRDLSVRELVAMMASLYPHPMDVEEALELAGLSDAADQRTQKLSGGQTQRARFAVALVSDPDPLVLDEPTVAMDVEGRRAFWSSMRAFAARGKTILFATHYLEEADANADRAVLISRGRIVADGPTTEIKGRVGTRTIRATLPNVSRERLAQLPGVASADRHGDSIILTCTNSDTAIRALLAQHPLTRDLEITGAALEDAFVQLTGGLDDPVSRLDESATRKWSAATLRARQQRERQHREARR